MLRFLAMVMVVGVVKVAGDERADTALDACGMPRAYGPTSHCFNGKSHSFSLCVSVVPVSASGPSRHVHPYRSRTLLNLTPPLQLSVEYAEIRLRTDRTHHTCCLLGPEARRYADASGNPIGQCCIQTHK